MTERPGYPVEAVLRTTSLRRRVAHLLTGLAGASGATLIGLLWATEPGPLPARTHAAFAALVVAGLSWAGFAVWSLTRLPLFALDRVVAGWLATGFSALTAAVTLVVAVTRPGPVPATVAVAALGAAGCAVLVLRRAIRIRADLLRRLG